MQPAYDPKSLTDSLELDYFQRPRPLNLWMRRSLWTALIATSLLAAWALWPSNHRMLQAGPVSTPHAMFNHQCEQCHTVAFATASRFVPGSVHITSTPDSACLACHPAPHHTQSRPVKSQHFNIGSDNCTSCHKEHRGHAMLARPSDRLCTQCHAHFSEEYQGSKYGNISDFSSHPEFELLRTSKKSADPGNIEFNHAKHINFSVDDFAKLKRDSRVWQTAAAALGELKVKQCAYCHELDSAGQYMKPTRFDPHCQDCHGLYLPLKAAEPIPPPLQTAFDEFLQTKVHHPAKGQRPEDVRAAVLQRYLQFAQANAGALILDSAPLDQWMVLPGLRRPAEPATQSQIDWVNEHAKIAETMFFDKSAGCAHCHEQVLTSPRDKNGLPAFDVTPRIPARWFERASFNHHAHRFMDCMACHAQATTSAHRSDVMMPKIESCQSCHKPHAGSARADCLECHRFHREPVDPAWRGKYRTSPK